jgi:hypothetical protein
MDMISHALQKVTLFNPAYVISHLLKAEHKVRSSIEMATHTIQQLQHRRLAIDFLSSSQLQTIFSKVQRISSAAGCRLVPEHPSDLLQLETSYFSSGSTISIVLHVPISPRESVLRLFRFKPFPLPLSDHLTLTPKVDTDVLAISHGDRFSVELRHADLMDCHSVNRFYLCEKHGVLRKTLSASCLGALWLQKFEEVHKLCGMQVQPYHEAVVQLANNWYLTYTPRAFTAPVQCQNGSETDLHLRVGVNKHRVDPSCRAILKDHVVIADMNQHLDVQIQHFEWAWDENTLGMLTSPELSDTIQAYLTDGNEQFLLSDVLQTRSVSRRTSHTLLYVGLGLAVLGIVAAVIFFAFNYNRFLFLRRFIRDQLQHLRQLLPPAAAPRLGVAAVPGHEAAPEQIEMQRVQ